MTEKSKEHLEVVNKLKSLEERKEMLEEQLGVLKYRTTDLSNAVLLERSELVDELTGLTNTIGEVIYGGENMMSNLRRIMQKVNEEEPSDDKPSLDKTNARNSASLMRNKSAHVGHIREGREGAYLYWSGGVGAGAGLRGLRQFAPG